MCVTMREYILPNQSMIQNLNFSSNFKNFFFQKLYLKCVCDIKRYIYILKTPSLFKNTKKLLFSIWFANETSLNSHLKRAIHLLLGIIIIKKVLTYTLSTYCVHVCLYSHTFTHIHPHISYLPCPSNSCHLGKL
uniref:Uncharacterized protein n=1 Tax=Rousettus aegyptiacus TaxID=9407 RepID=A0A7J8E902_ROUAE|nr:hypothetical protein HJG63_008182 [Rousettus aegyptiacus]